MPYTPPTGNAVTFNFTGSYTVPPGNAVVFNFGGGGPPPPTAQLPTGLRALQLFEEDWFFLKRNRFAPIPGPVIPFARGRGDTTLLMRYQEDYIPPPRRTIYFVPTTRRRRVVLFTVT